MPFDSRLNEMRVRLWVDDREKEKTRREKETTGGNKDRDK